MLLSFLSTKAEAKTAKQLWGIKQQIKELKKIEDMLTEELKAVANGKTTEFGDYIYTLKSRKGSVLYATIPELKGVNLDMYRGEDITYFELIKK